MLNQKLLYDTIEKFNAPLGEKAYERLERYAELLVETNKSFNLTAITQPEEVTVKHFADCLAVFKYVDFPENSSLIDVGTGAGFPGLVLLIARPDLKVTLLDSTKKKLGFIESVLKGTGLNAQTVHARAEDAGKMPEYREKFDFAAARAVANLTNLSEYCLPFVKVGGRFVSMKSAAADDEILQAKKAVSLLGGEICGDNLFDLVENVSRRILVIKKISQTPTKYPRASAKIAKNPIK